MHEGVSKVRDWADQEGRGGQGRPRPELPRHVRGNSEIKSNSIASDESILKGRVPKKTGREERGEKVHGFYNI